MIEAIELTSKGRGRSGAGPRPDLDRVSFDVYPGQVTALLGAPGVGKSSVLRMMTQQEPAKGRTLFGGRPYRALRPAVREVGLALDPDAVHPGRTVRHHLALYGAAGGVPRARVGEVLEIGGLTLQSHTRCGQLDPAQRQRLSIAAALLGDPAALILDEPHALDAHGLAWFHALIRAYAAQGRTVLVTASDPASLAGTADHVVVLRRDEADGRTRVIASRSAAEVFDEHRATVVIVRSPQAARLAVALEAQGATLAGAGPGALEVRGLDRARIGEIAHTAGICLHELAEAGRDEDGLYGIELSRTAIAPAPTDVDEAEDAAIGVSAGPRTGWRSGVRLIGSGGGTATIEDAEVVEPVEGSGTGSGGSGLTGPGEGSGASGSGVSGSGVSTSGVSTMASGVSGPGGLASPSGGAMVAAAENRVAASTAVMDDSPVHDSDARYVAEPSADSQRTVSNARTEADPATASHETAARNTVAAPREAAARNAGASPENAARDAAAASAETARNAAAASHETAARNAAPTSPETAARNAAAAAYAAELAAAYAAAFAEDEAAAVPAGGTQAGAVQAFAEAGAVRAGTAAAASTAPHSTPSTVTARTPEEASA